MTRRSRGLFLFIFLVVLVFLYTIDYKQWSKEEETSELVIDDTPVPSEVPSTSPLVETTLPGGAPSSGFTTFDNLYLWNGTFYAITSDPTRLPDRKTILSLPVDRKPLLNLDPTNAEMQIISRGDAQAILGESAIPIEGVSIVLYDTSQFMAHYYHWWGEIILGAMRVYSGLELVPGEKKPLALPSRFLLPFVENDSWRDRAGVNGPFMRAAFPSASIERADYWRDLIKLNHTFVFERVVIISRTAAHRHPLSISWYKMISSAMNTTTPTYFWEPLRQRLVKHVVGYLPIVNLQDTSMSSTTSTKPLVTYISRQETGRRLTAEAHNNLIEALKRLEKEGVCEVNVAVMENMAYTRQIEIVAKSTIIVGVHGNGLTHQLWMPPSQRSTVFEIFYPKTYLHDYEILARNMGHRHYAVWNDTLVTYGPGKWFEGVDTGNRTNFHGSWTPVHGPTIADMIRKRLAEPL